MRALLLIAIISFGLVGFGQQNLIPLNHLRQIEVEAAASAIDSIQHFGSRPYLESKWDLSKTFGYAKDTTKYYYQIAVIAMRDHMFEAQDQDFWVGVDPLYDLQMSWDLADTSGFQDTAAFYNNTRGARIIGNIGKKVSFETFFFENQSQFPQYIRDFNDSTQVIPGQGRYKEYKNGGYDYNSAYGWVSFSPNKNLNFQIGHGKQFIGHGYRSMLLSDNSFNYPYIKATAWLLEDKLQYSFAYAELQNLQRLPLGEVPESLFKRKGLGYSYLSYIPHPRVELGLFESIIWETWDSTGTQPFDIRSAVPIIGVNSAILGLDDANNVLLGLNARIKVFDWLHTYGQIALDHTRDGGVAYQAGAKFYHIGVQNLHFQVEYNYAPEQMYRTDNWLHSYSHMNQGLTHPLGTNFEETIGAVNYRWRRFYGQMKYHHQVHEALDNGNLLLAYDANEQFSLFEIKNIYDVQVGWYLTPKTNANLSVGWMHRNHQVGLITKNTDWVYLTLRTSLVNKYYDF